MTSRERGDGNSGEAIAGDDGVHGAELDSARSRATMKAPLKAAYFFMIVCK